MKAQQLQLPAKQLPEVLALRGGVGLVAAAAVARIPRLPPEGPVIWRGGGGGGGGSRCALSEPTDSFAS